jgi:hypothetical protein
MTYSVLNKAVSNFVLFSITQGDGSHARTLIKAQPSLSEEVRNKVLDLIAKIPVLGKEREELDRLLGFTQIDPASSRRPPKIAAPFGTPSSPSQEEWVARVLTLSDISVQVLSFLEISELAQAMRVNSLWQKNAMHAVCCQLRCAKELSLNELFELCTINANNKIVDILHLQSANKYLKYFEGVLNLTMHKNAEKVLFSAKPDGTLYWTSRESVTSVYVHELASVVAMESQDIHFSCMRHLEFVVGPTSQEIPVLLKWCPATLRSISISNLNDSRQVRARSLEMIASLSQLTELTIYTYQVMSDDEFDVLSRSFPNLTKLRLISLFSEGKLQNTQCSVLGSAHWKLHCLVLNNMDITFLGMNALASAFPELTSLDLTYTVDDELSDDEPSKWPISQGLTVLARSWPKLSSLGITGTLNAEMLDMIMAGHPRLEHLRVRHYGGVIPEYWEQEEGIKAIAKYGSHLTSLDIAGVFCTYDILCATLGRQCQRLQSLELDQPPDFDANGLLRLRSALPNALIAQTPRDDDD